MYKLSPCETRGRLAEAPPCHISRKKTCTSRPPSPTPSKPKTKPTTRTEAPSILASSLNDIHNTWLTRLDILLSSPQRGLSVITLQTLVTLIRVCVFFILNHSFYPSTSSTTSVHADSSILEEIQVLLWSQSYATEILRCHVRKQ